VPAGRAGRVERAPLCSPLVHGLCYEGKSMTNCLYRYIDIDI
jgi:hypothetical protein